MSHISVHSAWNTRTNQPEKTPPPRAQAATKRAYVRSLLPDKQEKPGKRDRILPSEPQPACKPCELSDQTAVSEVSIVYCAYVQCAHTA